MLTFSPAIHPPVAAAPPIRERKLAYGFHVGTSNDVMRSHPMLFGAAECPQPLASCRLAGISSVSGTSFEVIDNRRGKGLYEMIGMPLLAPLVYLIAPAISCRYI